MWSDAEGFEALKRQELTRRLVIHRLHRAGSRRVGRDWRCRNGFPRYRLRLRAVDHEFLFVGEVLIQQVAGGLQGRSNRDVSWGGERRVLLKSLFISRTRSPRLLSLKLLLAHYSKSNRLRHVPDASRRPLHQASCRQKIGTRRPIAAKCQPCAQGGPARGKVRAEGSWRPDGPLMAETSEMVLWSKFRVAGA